MRASLVAQLIKKMPAMGYLGSIPGLGRSPGEGKGYPLRYSGPENSMDCIFPTVAESDRTEPERLSLSLLRWLSGKEPPCQCRRRRLDPWVRKIPWRRKYQPTPVFLLEIPTDGGAWRAAYRGVAKSQTPLGQPSTRS